ESMKPPPVYLPAAQPVRRAEASATIARTVNCVHFRLPGWLAVGFCPIRAEPFSMLFGLSFMTLFFRLTVYFNDRHTLWNVMPHFKCRWCYMRNSRGKTIIHFAFFLTPGPTWGLFRRGPN